MSSNLNNCNIKTELLVPENKIRHADSLISEKFLGGKPSFPFRSESEIQKKTAPVTGCVCAIIPCLNEELVIGSLVLKVKSEVDRVIVVDDGSTDKTAEIARLSGAEVVSYPNNKGKAYALRAGLEVAKKRDCIAAVFLDGDGQHHTKDISKVLAPVLNGEADLVIGSRFLDKKNSVPAYRRLGQKTLDFATNLSCEREVTSKFKCTDSQSGFRALGPKALENMDFFSDGYNIESDMIAHMLEKGLRICEVPISVRYDVPNKHKKNPVTHGLGVLGNIVGMIGYSRPLLVFGIPGLCLFAIGLISGIFVISEYYNFVIFHYLMLFISFNCIVVGLLMVTSGLILNSLVIMMRKGEKMEV